MRSRCIGRQAFVRNKRATGRAKDLGDIEGLESRTQSDNCRSSIVNQSSLTRSSIFNAPTVVSLWSCDDAQRVSHAEPRPLGRARGEFDDGEGAEGEGRAPGFDRARDFHDAPVTRDEHDVDRELHEERVNAVGRRDDERRAGREPLAAEEPAFPRRRIHRRLDRRRERRRAARAVDAQRVRRRVPREERFEEVRRRHVNAIRRVPAGAAVPRSTALCTRPR